VIIDGKVTYEVVTDKYKEALKYIRRLWTEGLMGIETFTQDWDTYLSKFQNADGDIMVGSMCGYLSWDAIDQDLALDTYTCIEPLVGPDGTQYWRYYPKGVEDAHLFHMTDKCEYPEILMRVMDTWNTEYYAYSAMRGVEGIHWEYTDDGHIKKIKYTADEIDADPFLQAGLTTSWKGPWSVTIDTFSKEIELSVQDADRLERCNMYKPFLQDVSTVYPAFTFVSEEDNETLSIIENDIKTYVKRMEADFVMNGNIDERWDEFVNEIEKMGLSKALAIRQAAID
jgi:putative aldouronate transport system substrate-binding protein